jgi:hypothetical protein
MAGLLASCHHNLEDMFSETKDDGSTTRHQGHIKKGEEACTGTRQPGNFQAYSVFGAYARLYHSSVFECPDTKSHRMCNSEAI